MILMKIIFYIENIKTKRSQGRVQNFENSKYYNISNIAIIKTYAIFVFSFVTAKENIKKQWPDCMVVLMTDKTLKLNIARSKPVTGCCNLANRRL